MRYFCILSFAFSAAILHAQSITVRIDAYGEYGGRPGQVEHFGGSGGWGSRTFTDGATWSQRSTASYYFLRIDQVIFTHDGVESESSFAVADGTWTFSVVHEGNGSNPGNINTTITAHFAASNPDPDPDPEPSTGPNEAHGSITNNTDETQTYFWQITYADGTTESATVTLGPGESVNISGGLSDQPYTMSVYQYNGEGPLTLVDQWESSEVESGGSTSGNTPSVTDEDGNVTKDDTGHIVTQLEQIKNIEESNNDKLDEQIDNQEEQIANQEEQIENQDEQTAKLDEVTDKQDAQISQLGNISDKLGSTGDGSGVSPDDDEYPTGPAWSEDTVSNLDQVGGMVDTVIGMMPSLDALPLVSGRNYTYEMNLPEFYGMNMSFTLDLTPYTSPIELVRLLEEALVIIMFVVACINIIRGGFAS